MKLDKIFRTAVEYKASDIYINTGIKPVLRINGDLILIEEHPVLTNGNAEEYIFETMNEQQKKTFLSQFELDYGIEVAGVARFRVNAFFQRKGAAAVFRLIPTEVMSMTALGLPEQLRKVPFFLNGIVLVTGPTGCGKSTTLASLIHEINTTQKQHIITIEDPIEFVHENKLSIIDQRELGSNTLSFANALRSSLREDPNVILIGEMRDLETMSLAITAAETGHLVLSTLHTSGAAKAVDRIIDSFPASLQNQIRLQLSESMRCVIWQSLLKTADSKKRVAAFEILFNNNAVANMIRKNKTYQIPSAMEMGLSEGMQTMKKAITDLVAQRLINEETAAKNLPAEFEV